MLELCSCAPIPHWSLSTLVFLGRFFFCLPSSCKPLHRVLIQPLTENQLHPLLSPPNTSPQAQGLLSSCMSSLCACPTLWRKVTGVWNIKPMEGTTGTENPMDIIKLLQRIWFPRSHEKAHFCYLSREGSSPWNLKLLQWQHRQISFLAADALFWLRSFPLFHILADFLVSMLDL